MKKTSIRKSTIAQLRDQLSTKATRYGSTTATKQISMAATMSHESRKADVGLRIHRYLRCCARSYSDVCVVVEVCSVDEWCPLVLPKISWV